MHYWEFKYWEQCMLTSNKALLLRQDHSRHYKQQKYVVFNYGHFKKRKEKQPWQEWLLVGTNVWICIQSLPPFFCFKLIQRLSYIQSFKYV